jgi:hypothetical protein
MDSRIFHAVCFNCFCTPLTIFLTLCNPFSWIFGEELDIKHERSDYDNPVPTRYYPGPTARSQGERMFQIKHHNQLAASAYYLPVSMKRTNFFLQVGPAYDDDWNFTTRSGVQLNLRMAFGVAQEVEVFLSRTTIDGILGLSFVPYVMILSRFRRQYRSIYSKIRETSSPTEPEVRCLFSMLMS